jgi:hypothetical protein
MPIHPKEIPMATLISREIAAKAVEAALAKAQELHLPDDRALDYVKRSLKKDAGLLSAISLVAHDLSEALDPVEIAKLMKSSQAAADKAAALQKSATMDKATSVANTIDKVATSQAQAQQRDPKNRPSMDLSKVEIGKPIGMRG